LVDTTTVPPNARQARCHSGLDSAECTTLRSLSRFLKLCQKVSYKQQTNLVLTDGRILVGAIHLGKNVMVGHLAVIGAGIHMGDGAEFSHTSICGCRVTLGQHAIVKPGCGLDHSCEIGERSEVGSRSYVGMGASIGSDVHVPPGSVIPRRSRIRTQAEMDQWRALETKELMELRLQLAQRIQSSDE
ncbi:MAG: DapH/DapD/GlmU-related protein, partial [Planctomycetia bacterium]|nr:DapH/DapD/GlmU-related protein [Planctomycetia bacterium]